MNNMQRIVVIGATSMIATHCARLWITKSPAKLTLVGRDAERLDRLAKDLRVRSPQSEISTIQAEFLNPEMISALVKNICQSGPIDIVLIAHGALPEQIACQSDLRACSDALQINGISPVLFAEAFAKEMEIANRGTLALISSVAGDRGRKSNYVYGAAKGLVTRYAQGLQQRFAGGGVSVVLIKPGPTDTPMTAHLKKSGAKLAPVEKVAEQIVHGIAARKCVVYTPRKWLLIMNIIRHMPQTIFNRLNI